MKKKLAISFSGGRTSGYMTKWLLDNKSNEFEIIVIFANTGEEHESTLDFVHNCDLHFGFNTVWVEAVVHHNQRRGNTHRVVRYETASRKGEPFEEIIKKHGIPNQAFPHCTRELKLAPINSYIKSVGWARRDYSTAIGIRCDESRRVRKDAAAVNIIYPLIDMIPTDKQDVLDWWDEQIFDLLLKEHQGNCKWCWKKSLKKHMMLIKETPSIYEFPKKMERLYPRIGPEFKKAEFIARDRVFFRGSRSANDLFDMYVTLDNVSNTYQGGDMYLDGGCSESCELYMTE